MFDCVLVVIMEQLDMPTFWRTYIYIARGGMQSVDEKGGGLEARNPTLPV